MHQIITSACDRDMRSGWGAIVYIVNKNGIQTDFIKTKQSWFGYLEHCLCISYIELIQILYILTKNYVWLMDHLQFAFSIKESIAFCPSF